MKKQLLFVNVLALLLFTNCKKDPQSTPPSEDVQAQGTWSLASESGNNNGIAYSYTTTQYPCIAGNKVIINTDGTASLEYTSKDTCFIYKSATSYETLGMPGEKRSATWTQNNKTIYIQVANANKPVVGNLAVVNGKQQLTFNDTTTVGQSSYTSTGVFVK